MAAKVDDSPILERQVWQQFNPKVGSVLAQNAAQTRCHQGDLIELSGNNPNQALPVAIHAILSETFGAKPSHIADCRWSRNAMKPNFRPVSSVFAALLAVLLTTPALALDCAKATDAVDKLICTTPKLKTADEAMSAAYFKLLRETKDPDFHEALIRSQRRWLKQRSQGPQRYGVAEYDKTDDREVLLKVTRDRANVLEKSTLIKAMEAQRKEMVSDNGGPYAGFDVSCEIYPPPYGNWSYECLGSHQRQNGNRICGASTEWASGHITTNRLVSEIRNGEVKNIASCSLGYADSDAKCPGSGEDNPHWDMSATAGDYMPPRPGEIWKYDPDVDIDEYGGEWMQDCLFAPAFPPQDQRGASTDGKAP